MRKNNFWIINILAISLLFIVGCSTEYETSNITGWDYNNPRNGGFQKVPYGEQETGPGLILIEGGTFTMGQVEQDVTFENHNVPRRVTVSSFYMDETEITNYNWCEYLYWINRTYISYPMIYKKALPDTLSWREKMGNNETYVEYYLRHPAYRDYPVVGVSWNQANDFAAWRTDRVNEYILIREGVLVMNPVQHDNPFTTDSYLAGQYQEGLNPQGQIANLDPNMGAALDPNTGKFKARNLATRNVRMEDGILLPRYRLPTEAEWEFAAYGLIGNTLDERIIERRLYPWDGHWVRNPQENYQGDMLANFVRGRGDYMGVSGHLNDNADVTAPAYSYWPNDYGLYNMAGNVSEWVLDVYRPLTSEDADEFRPFRGNVFKTKVLDASGSVAEKYDAAIYDIYGIEQYIEEFKSERKGKADRNYGYVPNKKKIDSTEAQLLRRIDQLIVEAKKFMETKQERKASEQIQILLEDVFDEFVSKVENDPDLEGYLIQICPMLRKGISDYIINTPGNVQMREVTAEENLKRSNYRIADNIDYLDGDLKSSIFYPAEGNEEFFKLAEQGQRNEDWAMYQRGKEKYVPGPGGTASSLISDNSRVYKGASWKDRAYYLSPGTRRFLEQDRSTATIGFRCAMDRIGSPTGLGIFR
ncbi:MAG: hypothetical protein CL846_06755 [Crocinitomicaceae bacterium]|nr:hypothetical protein [Crocinitomicaceae bacterium]|tara:strand:- start:3466 stop:5397 length:1932 start_codon:yes stop_codon:yes gene_type:complete